MNCPICGIEVGMGPVLLGPEGFIELCNHLYLAHDLIRWNVLAPGRQAYSCACGFASDGPGMFEHLRRVPLCPLCNAHVSYWNRDGGGDDFVTLCNHLANDHGLIQPSRSTFGVWVCACGFAGSGPNTLGHLRTVDWVTHFAEARLRQ